MDAVTGCKGFSYCCKPKEVCTGNDGRKGFCEYLHSEAFRPLLGKCSDDEYCYRVPYRSSFEMLNELVQTGSSITSSHSSDTKSVDHVNQTALSEISANSYLGAGSWFNFIAGCASVLGALLAIIYPVEIKQIPQSEYRSNKWTK